VSAVGEIALAVRDIMRTWRTPGRPAAARWARVRSADGRWVHPIDGPSSRRGQRLVRELGRPRRQEERVDTRRLLVALRSR
jgi:hypothetical protein